MSSRTVDRPVPADARTSGNADPHPPASTDGRAQDPQRPGEPNRPASDQADLDRSGMPGSPKTPQDAPPESGGVEGAGETGRR